MRSKCALYVDAGYLLASAATRVTGTSLRNGIHVDYGPLVKAMIRQAEQTCGVSVLRVHWYDSARDGVPDAQQERIGELPKVKLRLGRFGVDGQQKGVDLRIGLDLVAHARNGAADVFFLVSGDDDLTEAVEEAQSQGVEVVVLAVPTAEDKPHAVSRHLIRAADQLELLTPATFDSTVMKVEVPKTRPAPPPAPAVPVHAVPTPLDVAAIARQAPSAPTPAAPPPPPPPSAVAVYSASTGGTSRIAPEYVDPDQYDEQIAIVITNVLASYRQSAGGDAVTALASGKPSIPRDMDRALLVDLSDAIGVYDLSDPIRFRLRQRFWELYDDLA